MYQYHFIESNKPNIKHELSTKYVLFWANLSRKNDWLRRNGSLLPLQTDTDITKLLHKTRTTSSTKCVRVDLSTTCHQQQQDGLNEQYKSSDVNNKGVGEGGAVGARAPPPPL